MPGGGIPLANGTIPDGPASDVHERHTQRYQNAQDKAPVSMGNGICGVAVKGVRYADELNTAAAETGVLGLYDKPCIWQ